MYNFHVPTMSKEDHQDDVVHIYLKSDGKVPSKILEGASAHERYIILMNDSLQARSEKDLGKIKDLESRISELEDEIDSSDTRRNYIKNLLKNFHEMHKMNEKLNKLETSMKKETVDYVRAYKERATWHLRVLHAIFIVLFGLGWEFADNWTVMLMGITFVTLVAFHHSMIRNLCIPSFSECEEKAKTLKKEKKSILDAQDYIHEFLDSQ